MIDVSGGTSRFQNIWPKTNNTYALGSSTPFQLRWQYIYLNNNADVASDRRIKTNIQTSDLGLDFINELNPVSFNANGRHRPTYGLIAQEVSESLGRVGKTTSDFSGIATGSLESDTWSLAYSEFISPMIKAIQELSNKVDELQSQISGSV